MSDFFVYFAKNGQNIFFFVMIIVVIVLAIDILVWHFFHLRRGEKQVKDIYSRIFKQDQSQKYILLRNKDFKIIMVSDGFDDTFHVDLSLLKNDIDFLENVIDQEDRYVLEKAIEKWNHQDAFSYLFKQKGTEQYFTLTISITKDKKYTILSFRDDTKYQNEINDLKQQLIRANEVSDYKATFLSKMSHEIRTPMNGIIGMLTLADHDVNQDGQAAYHIHKAQEISQYLLSLINEVLDISRMEAGKLELEVKPIDIYQFESQLNTIFRKMIEEKNIQFNIEYHDFDVRYVMGDELRIMQILVNLVSNAYKFTEHGEIKVTFRQMYRAEDNINFMMKVHDTGKGMKRDFIYYLFKPFEQENAEISKNYGGSGLGMAITDQLVRLMGGEIIVESLQGQGTDFTVFLDLPIASNQVEIEDKPQVSKEHIPFTYAGKTILLAEDNEINAEICLSVLEQKGAYVEHVQTGKQVIEQFENHHPGYYDFILMDIHMPEMDGYQATQEIRKLARQDAKTIPIFALSADAYVENKRYSKKIGMNGHFSKPIDFEQMAKELEDFFNGRGDEHEI